MNKFKCGDRVRFINNELNNSELGNNITKKSFSVVGTSPTAVRIEIDGEFRWFHHSRFELAELKEGSLEWAGEQLLNGKMVIADSMTYPYFMTDTKGIGLAGEDGFIDNDDYLYESVDAFMLSHISRGNTDGWKLFEPKPKFANVKVGDWVESKDGRIGYVESIRAIDGKYPLLVCFYPNKKVDITSPYDISVGFELNGRYLDGRETEYDLIRIVPPCEVVVDFGSFEGVVRPLFDRGLNWCEVWKPIDDSTKIKLCELNYYQLPDELKSIVDRLLTAQRKRED